MDFEPPKDESHIEYFPNGKKQCEGNLRHGKRDGKWTFWNKQGQTISIGHYKNGTHHLKWVYLDDQGRKVIENYDNGKKHGEWHYWDNEDRQIIEGHHKNDGKHGLWDYWDNSGHHRIENYLNGKKNGICKYFCKDFLTGDDYNFWDKNELINQILDSFLTAGYSVAGNPLRKDVLAELELNYIENIKNGIFIFKYDGQVVLEGNYKNDNKQGSWMGFDANGKMMSWLEFRDDEIQSDRTEEILKEIEEKKLAAKKEKELKQFNEDKILFEKTKKDLEEKESEAAKKFPPDNQKWATSQVNEPKNSRLDKEAQNAINPKTETSAKGKKIFTGLFSMVIYFALVFILMNAFLG